MRRLAKRGDGAGSSDIRNYMRRSSSMTETLNRVVYVEDEPDIQAIVQIALGAIGGLQVTIFSSGHEAIAKAIDAAPQLFVLDVMMPGLDGPGTLRLLREQPPLKNVPAIFMTAKAQPQEIAALLQQGAIAVVSKPFDPLQLANELRGHWQRWQQAGATPA
jgi:two-component system, OmpR family, response regulator